MNRDKIDLILNFLKEQKTFDFKGCSYEMIARRIARRYVPTKSSDLTTYLKYLKNNREELEHLVQILTINVSQFFRNPLVFEILNTILAIQIKMKLENGNSLRIWSAGCATGEEIYSVALLLAEQQAHSEIELDVFGTDIDPSILNEARQGVYQLDAVKEVKYGILQKYFTLSDDKYVLSEKIKEMVSFSQHDLLSEKSSVPPASVYGEFDIVLCRNVLIYYNPKYQQIILKKLYNSLISGGYLILGDAEIPGEEIGRGLLKVTPYNKIYRKLA